MCYRPTNEAFEGTFNERAFFRYKQNASVDVAGPPVILWESRAIVLNRFAGTLSPFR